jgi:hypothetical protein
MNIVFFNIANIGDSFIPQEIIKHTCQENPSIQFSIFTYSNSFLYEKIPNLQILIPNTNYTKQLESNDNPYNFLTISNDIHSILKENGMKPFFKLNNSTLAINMWVGGYTKYLPIEKLECNLIHMQIAFINALQEIKEFIHLQYTPLPPYQLIPQLPLQPIELFDTWYAQNINKYIVFYYNYEARSGQSMITNEKEHTMILLNLANQFPSAIFLVPRISTSMQEQICVHNLTNIVDCRTKFNLYESSNCKNLVDLTYICSFCNVSIHYDIGACYFFFNKEHLFHTSKNTIIHLSKRDFFFKQFYTTLQYTNIPLVKPYHFSICNDWQDVLLTLYSFLSQKIKEYST